MSCLKETAVPIESAFSIESSEGEVLSVMIQLKHSKLLGVIKESEAWFKKIRKALHSKRHVPSSILAGLFK